MTDRTAPKWQVSKYGHSETLYLSSILHISATYEVQSRGNPTPYSASVFGSRLTKRFATIDEAKTAAIVFAKNELAAAMVALNGGIE